MLHLKVWKQRPKVSRSEERESSESSKSVEHKIKISFNDFDKYKEDCFVQEGKGML